MAINPVPEPSGGHAPAFRRIADLLGDRFNVTSAVREQHARDESPLPSAAPDAVAFPISTAEVVEIAKVCTRYGVPLVPFGAGTSLEGHVLATAGGLSLDLTRMNRILRVDVDDLDVVVEPGVTRLQLEERLRRDGLFFPVDPGADATLGGMVATGASGTTTVRYGNMRDNVLALEVVLADGHVTTTARRARKSSAGYDLTRLFVGSEGTLGIITQATLRVYGIPDAISGATCHFPTVDRAVAAVISILQVGVPVARIEFLDDRAIEAVNEYSGLSYEVAPTLLFEFHGSPAGVEEQARDVGEIVAEFGGIAYRSAIEHAARTKLWRARHESFYASLALRPGAKAITTDVCVPISRLAECILETRRDIERLSLTTTMVGHVGDGNFHVMVLVDPDDEAELRAAEELNERLIDRALELDGTSTGEHGVGLRKRGALQKELPGAVPVMRALKQTLDPQNILNPGKVLPPE